MFHPLWANVPAVAATAVGNAWASRGCTFGHRSRIDRRRYYRAAVALVSATVAVSSAALAFTLSLGGRETSQSLTLLGTWLVAAVCRFALLRAWVIRMPSAGPKGPGDVRGRGAARRT